MWAHAGDESSTYVAECLHDEIDRALARVQSTADWASAVTSAFSTVDENLMDESESMMWTSGTTVVCAAFHKEERELWVANLGDSRCVLARHDQGGPKVVAEPLSSDHKPWVEGEIQRIERAGCRVTEGRINGTATAVCSSCVLYG
jgi:serine/threonine protein phosphatase PrpC